MTRFWLQNGLVGLGAGACSALMFASLLSRSPLALPLYFLAPLPIVIVALGWSHWAGFVAVIVGALSLALAIDGFSFLVFLVCIGVPAWWLGYLALLARPAAADETLEWYPPGRLVVWAAVIGATILLIGLAQIGTDEATIRETLRRGIETMLRTQMRMPADKTVEFPVANPETLAVVIPPAFAVLTTMVLLFDLWLAGRIVLISGRLRRPWPELAALKFPPATLIALAAAFGASFLPGTIGLAAALPAATLLMAYSVLGFAVLHGITRHIPNRGLVLFGVYAAVAVIGWPLLLMTLLGLVDSALDLRARVVAARGPPARLP